ncbi:mannose-1-phosphate guanylyltransferase/mannose-6-phosphate isomerase [uncultured Prochlorococcus sp.]|uniref:mannose-1-phosphate guanylyltransferase/mannose-6-phosphate isomerase n=1 Tax=uncultured Prochlorococcus sp. TaxID=159733 RepID=UPI002590A020|nr:mannose-1-phosphate guanylyltransferase/mannose-6-phosphate isomerase [uncultured Prochlorococcus sp.]
MDGLDENYTDKAKILPVILCGGEGTRLWPLSRKSFPKQFLSINNSKDESLLQNTQKRLTGIKGLIEPILICNSEHRFIVAEQMREINVNPKSIMLEPFGRNTAPAILLAAFKSLETENNPHLLILSSDHQIKNEENFRNMIEIGKTYSSDDKLVTFGVVPRSPETGYGYIKSQKPFDLKNIKGIKISEFIEKPNLEKAKELIKIKSFTWNSGIFLFKAKTIIDETKKLSPEIFKACEKTFSNSFKDFDFQRLDEQSFEDCPNISIDNAIMENTKKGIVIPLDAEWSDMGSWKSVWENSDKDGDGNFSKGRVLSEKTYNCFLSSESKLLVSLGINNLVVIDTDDVTLVAEKNESESLKKLVKDLQVRNIKEAVSHKRVYRPWGFYLSIAEDSRFQVKIIHVKPGAKLSLQMHHHRSEHWVVVKGTAKVEINNEITFLSENESTYIPLGSKHRLTNPGKIPLEIIEIQSGSYVGEDDIVRFEDLYGRKN